MNTEGIVAGHQGPQLCIEALTEARAACHATCKCGKGCEDLGSAQKPGQLAMPPERTARIERIWPPQTDVQMAA
eukprot:1157612-Pelagomonas_calceolata.AAC.1